MADQVSMTDFGQKERDRWEDLIYTGPGTPLGAIMRQYWQPIIESRRLEKGRPLVVTVLGERFTAWRGESGSPFVVAERCPHRGTLLKTGGIEGDEIRCLYHGWKFSGAGACTHAPAETEAFTQRIKIRSAPAADYGGWVFAYLGEGDPPELPRKWEIDNARVLHAKGDVWPCNWLQLRENSYDPLHVNFTHRVGPLGAAVSETLPRIEFLEHPWGFQTKAVRDANNQRIVETFFPNSGHVIVPQPNDYSQPWIDLVFWHVPIDDHHCATYKIYCSRVEGKVAEDLVSWFESADQDISRLHDEFFELGIPAFPNSMHLTESQDYVAQVGQGAIADRTQEHLGASDVAIVKMRRVMRTEVARARDGQPHRRWENRYGPARLPLPPGIKRQ